MLQVINQSDEEKMKMYMKSTKPELIRMLIECNKLLDMPPVVKEVGRSKEFVWSSSAQATTNTFTHTRKKGVAGCLIVRYPDGHTETYIHCKKCNTPIWEEDNKTDLHIKCPKLKKL